MPHQPSAVKQGSVQARGPLRGEACPSQAWWHVLLQPGPFRHKLWLQVCSLFTALGPLEPQCLTGASGMPSNVHMHSHVQQQGHSSVRSCGQCCRMPP